MNKKLLLLSKFNQRFNLVAFLGCTLFTIVTTSVSAQSGSTSAPAELSATGDLVRPDWLNATDYAAVITAERITTAVLLAAPNLKESEMALYTGYDRMLVYMQADLALNLLLDDVAVNNFNKVTLESITDPVLAKIQAIDFNTMYKELVEKLIRN